MKYDSFALLGNIIHSPQMGALEIFEKSYLVCEDKCVAGIFKELPERFAGIRAENHEQALIIPGMTDLHIHAPQYAFRGMGMDWELIDWLNNQTFPEEAKYADGEYAHRAYSLFAGHMKKSATTRACIFATRHRNATIQLMDLMEETGLITYVGKVNMDREAPEPLCEADAESSAFDTFGWLNSINGRYTRTMPILTPRFIPSCSDKLMEELREVRRAYELPIQSHLSENPGEIEWVKALRPDAKFYGDAYDRYDLFGERSVLSQGAKTVMAHCVWSSDEEINRIRQNGVFIAHCPASNMNLSSGIAPVRRYLELGMNIGLGSDVAGGQTESIFRAITDAIQVSKLRWRLVDESQKPLSFDEAFYLATKGGGAFFSKVGSFEQGFEFDALVLEDSALPSAFPLTLRQRLERAVYLGLDAACLAEKYVRGAKVL
jgi:guanine deaminase